MFSLSLFFLLNFLTELSLILKSEFLWWYYILSSFFFWFFYSFTFILVWFEDSAEKVVNIFIRSSTFNSWTEYLQSWFQQEGLEMISWTSDFPCTGWVKKWFFFFVTSYGKTHMNFWPTQQLSYVCTERWDKKEIHSKSVTDAKHMMWERVSPPLLLWKR